MSCGGKCQRAESQTPWRLRVEIALAVAAAEPRHQFGPPVGLPAGEHHPLGPGSAPFILKDDLSPHQWSGGRENPLPWIKRGGKGRRCTRPALSCKLVQQSAIDGVAPVSQLQPQLLGSGKTAGQKIVVTQLKRV